MPIQNKCRILRRSSDMCLKGTGRLDVVLNPCRENWDHFSTLSQEKTFAKNRHNDRSELGEPFGPHLDSHLGFNTHSERCNSRGKPLVSNQQSTEWISFIIMLAIWTSDPFTRQQDVLEIDNNKMSNMSGSYNKRMRPKWWRSDVRSELFIDSNGDESRRERTDSNSSLSTIRGCRWFKRTNNPQVELFKHT